MWVVVPGNDHFTKLCNPVSPSITRAAELYDGIRFTATWIEVGADLAGVAVQTQMLIGSFLLSSPRRPRRAVWSARHGHDHVVGSVYCHRTRRHGTWTRIQCRHGFFQGDLLPTRIVWFLIDPWLRGRSVGKKALRKNAASQYGIRAPSAACTSWMSNPISKDVSGK